MVKIMLLEELVGFTSFELRRIAFQLAIKLNLPHNFNKEKSVKKVEL